MNMKWYLAFFPWPAPHPQLLMLNIFLCIFLAIGIAFLESILSLSFLTDSISPPERKAIKTQTATGFTYLSAVHNLQEIINWVCKACDLCIINILLFRVHDFNKDSKNSKFIAHGLISDLRGFWYPRYYWTFGALFQGCNSGWGLVTKYQMTNLELTKIKIVALRAFQNPQRLTHQHGLPWSVPVFSDSSGKYQNPG